ncbi:TIGR03915 family putative DNA repair protein [Sphingobacterium suaedae]|uniref:TIGR03915 family putative DNA repair protein n=1 Tax=Sphingobacterium suaedae TaxID=1686402 RepID=A0ABW5KDK2_9SPHI
MLQTTYSTRAILDQMGQKETIFYFDGTWDGVLTAVFDAFEYKRSPLDLRDMPEKQVDIFADMHMVITEKSKADRVEAGLQKKVGKRASIELWHVYLSEQAGSALLVLRMAIRYFSDFGMCNRNYSDHDVLQVKRIVKSVSRERHRMMAFVRFCLLQDDLYFAHVAPDFNVLPLITRHFVERYADQRWLIYDQKRGYGIYYDLKVVNEVRLNDLDAGTLKQKIADKKQEVEIVYAKLWKRYFSAVNITERKNLTLHVQHVPKRYWSLLTEKDEY